jgi:4-hydroxyacetophenone monooxygenase
MHADLVSALQDAHLPSLMMALVHLTGETHHLNESYQLAYTPLGDDQGGLTPEQQHNIRGLAANAITEYLNGKALAPSPSIDTIRQMMDFLAGAPIPESYLPFLLEELALDGLDPRRPTPPSPALRSRMHVLIIGAGMSGLLMAVRLKQAGISFEIVEKNPDVGGTWFENTYPGCRVDSPSMLYSYSFEPDYEWPLRYSTQPLLFDYFQWVADKYDLRPQISFQTRVTEAVFDEDQQLWRVCLSAATGQQRVVNANVVISAVGQLNQPLIPEIPGQESFQGDTFHSARWRHDLDLKNKCVAVVGTGASATQFVPEIAPHPQKLWVFQRTPPWLLPTPQYHAPIGAGQLWLCKNVPFYAKWYRFFLFWAKVDGHYPLVKADPDWHGPPNAIGTASAEIAESLTAYLRGQLAPDDALLNDVVPNYPYGGKRALSDNGLWIPTLKRDNVQLVTEKIQAITPTGIVTADGQEYPVDVIIYGTGFRASHFLSGIRVIGRDGLDLQDLWNGDARTYLGMTIPGYPNFFCLYGPNTNLVVNGSLIFFVECSVRYILDCLKLLDETDSAALEPHLDVYTAYNQAVDEANRQMAWGLPGISNWYKNDKGRVSQNWPFPVIDYWQMTLQPRLADFILWPNRPHRTTTSAIPN